MSDTWELHGMCAGLDSALFFPERGESTDQARAVCADCPVQAECLQAALERNERFGIWGGTSARERQQLRRRRPISCGTTAGYDKHRRDGTPVCDDCDHAKILDNQQRYQDRKTANYRGAA